MRAHHVLMIENDEDGKPIAAHEVPNNEWARCRRKGWEFATAEQQAQYAQERAEAVNAAAVADAEAKAEAEAEAPKKRGRKPAEAADE